jgi:hypothetical protein
MNQRLKRVAVKQKEIEKHLGQREDIINLIINIILDVISGFVIDYF